MVFAESNRAVIRYLNESAWGTTPGTGVVRTARINKSSIVANKDTKVSDELRADRMVPAVLEVGANTEGSIDSELSCFSFDDFFQQFLLGAWTLPMYGLVVRGASVAVTGANQVTLAGADWTDWLADNQYLKLEGFLNPENNAYVRVNGAPSFSAGNTVITVDETLVVEAGSAYTKLFDAGDVILKSTSTAFEAANKINGGGATAFAGLTLKVGQKIYLEGLGKETGALLCNATNPTEGDEFTLSDGVDALTFEIRTNSALVSPGNVHVALSNTPYALAAAIKAAVNDQFRKQTLRITALISGTKEAGSIVFGATQVVDGDAFTVDDGGTSITFEFDDNAAVTGGRTAIDISGGLTVDQIGAAAEAAINASALNVTATYTAGTNTLDIVNDNYNGGALTEVTDSGNQMTTTNFSGGVGPSVALTNQRGTGGAITEALATLTATAFSGGDATKFGFFTIASLPDNDSIVTSETLGVDANGSSRTVVIKGSHLRNPGDIADITKQSISAETSLTDVDKNLLHDGLRVGSFDLGVKAKDICSLSFSFMGRATTALAGSTQLGASPYTVLDAVATEPVNATANVGQLLKDGSALTTAVTSIELKGDANLRSQPAVGQKFPAGIGYGRFSMTGKIEAYFQNFDLYNAFIDHTTASLAFSFEDNDHNELHFTVPAIKFTTDPVKPDGIDTDVMEPIEFVAFRDSVLKTMLMLDRFSSVYPASAA